MKTQSGQSQWWRQIHAQRVFQAPGVRPLSLDKARNALARGLLTALRMRHEQPCMKLHPIFKPASRRHAFTRLELLACLAGVALLVALALPALATSQSRSQVAQCLNNLRLIGRGVQMWGADHVNQPPWRTPISQGGSFIPTTKPGNAWFEYSYLSNELVTPRILACPADDGLAVASTWNQYVSAPFRNFATSYTLSMHTLTEFSVSPLSTDRNIRFSAGVGLCSFASVANVVTIDPLDSSVAWTNGVHGVQGNLVLVDGTALTITDQELREAFVASKNENGVPGHLLRPR
jgi:type II secretory pathway pseudopilin PulG